MDSSIYYYILKKKIPQRVVKNQERSERSSQNSRNRRSRSGSNLRLLARRDVKNGPPLRPARLPPAPDLKEIEAVPEEESRKKAPEGAKLGHEARFAPHAPSQSTSWQNRGTVRRAIWVCRWWIQALLAECGPCNGVHVHTRISFKTKQPPVPQLSTSTSVSIWR